MGKYLDRFPKVDYNVDGNTFNYKQTLTNLTFRLKMSDFVKKNKYSYYVAEVSEEDNLELLSYKLYEDPELHWVTALANDLIDPQYDWPINYRAYRNYIINKYKDESGAYVTVNIINPGTNYSANDYVTFTGGSGKLQSNSSISVDVNGAIATGSIKFYGYGYKTTDNITPVIITSTGANANLSIAITNRTDQQVIEYTEWKIQRYEKVITRFHEYTRASDEIIIEIDKIAYDAMPEYSFEQYTLDDNITLEETITKRIVYVSEHEMNTNDAKRLQRVVKKEYIPKILSEFDNYVRQVD